MVRPCTVVIRKVTLTPTPFSLPVSLIPNSVNEVVVSSHLEVIVEPLKFLGRYNRRALFTLFILDYDF